MSVGYPFSLITEKAYILNRKNKFVVIVKTEKKERLPCLLTNTGKLKNILIKNRKVLITRKNKGKTKCVIQAVHCPGFKEYAIINTRLQEDYFFRKLESTGIPGIGKCNIIKRHYKLKDSRIDGLVSCSGKTTLIELKSAIQRWPNRDTASYPDTLSKRGRKHIIKLTELNNNFNTIIVFISALPGASRFTPNRSVDPELHALLVRALDNGTRILSLGLTGYLYNNKLFINNKGLLPVFL